ncbi:Chromate resistance protein ChrB [Dactylosporangium sp. CA-139114]|uniref:Chromate resistance protein ChrB n=1 Tax=Dactylosporangium sp. CA-139114 TaxID=3239931 RepID=UPI003D981D9C
MGEEPFLLISVSTAGGPPGLRVTVWRTLRALGGRYPQQSVCLLPARGEVVRPAHRLLAQVRAKGGTGQAITVTVPDPRERAELVARFNAEREAGYARGRVTYAEVEESEADLGRLRARMAKITARDDFGAAGHAAAQARIERCAAALGEFEAAAVAAS